MREAHGRIGPYEIVIELAAGGMATTFIAHKRGDSFFERLVVIKRIHPWLLEDPKSSDMLREEARLGAALQHPHVVHVEDVTVSDKEVCLVMPYVESLSLGALLRAVRRVGERMPPAIASRIMLDVLSGLNAAHEAKDLRGQPLEIVHRDVSPNNILVGTEGQSRVIDFGIARAQSRLCQTQSGDMKGTIAYMSPEQLRRRELDGRTDIFAAGAVLYEMLAGEKLFDGRDEADILIGVLADEIPPLVDRMPDLAVEVDAVLSRALARDREERFSTARAFAEALEGALVPASAADVAAFVDRFGADEFTRRREAIRVFVDRENVKNATLGGRSDLPLTNRSTDEKKKRVRLAIVGSGALVMIASLIALAFAARRPRVDVARGTPAETPPAVSSLERADTPPPVAQTAAASSHEEIAPVDSQAPLPNQSAKTKVSPVVPRPGPIREKVDKRRAPELQENPYR